MQFIEFKLCSYIFPEVIDWYKKQKLKSAKISAQVVTDSVLIRDGQLIELNNETSKAMGLIGADLIHHRN